jgi:hypothetical protein
MPNLCVPTNTVSKYKYQILTGVQGRIRQIHNHTKKL